MVTCIIVDNAESSLTYGETYEVIDFTIYADGIALVTIINDNGVKGEHSVYRFNKNVLASRNYIINKIIK